MFVRSRRGVGDIPFVTSTITFPQAAGGSCECFLPPCDCDMGGGSVGPSGGIMRPDEMRASSAGGLDPYNLGRPGEFDRKPTKKHWLDEYRTPLMLAAGTLLVLSVAKGRR